MVEDIFYENIENNSIDNSIYRKVAYTGKMQFVYMNIEPMDNIHKEVHENHDQFIKVEKGEGIAILNGNTYKLYDGIGLIIPSGVTHQIKNTSKTLPLKLYTIYSPPEHPKETLQEKNPDKKEVFYKLKYLKYKRKYISLKKNSNFTRN